ncbi:hypothetical protein [Dyella acidisoli]|uniref:Uncharacterized protein n=1 Tax=Dyella acidisoli TaxID=1867834 RepID=A0ABQ5XMY0_9GAMM|nr:hypothetical protein [Dyella acidisoli]GLQ92566.1 hypothetical protein GCM10007901_15170 [Dyella acidisoli]
MGKLKVPSIQHAAGIWDPNPQKIAKRLLQLADKGPPFSYANLYKLTYDLISRSVPYEQVRSAAAAIKLTVARKNYLEILPLLKVYADNAGAGIVSQIVPRHYPIGKHLRVPVNPPLAYYKGEETHLPWFIFWKTNQFNDARLRLFVTMLREVFKQDPDYDDALVQLVICSESDPRVGRELHVIDAASIPALDKRERDEMLTIFAQGFDLALQARADGQSVMSESDDDRDAQSGQFDLFA